jgi:hypothetical protein
MENAKTTEFTNNVDFKNVALKDMNTLWGILVKKGYVYEVLNKEDPRFGDAIISSMVYSYVTRSVGW